MWPIFLNLNLWSCLHMHCEQLVTHFLQSSQQFQCQHADRAGGIFFISLDFSLIKLLMQTTDPDEYFYMCSLRTLLRQTVVTVPCVQLESQNYRITDVLSWSKTCQDNILLKHKGETTMAAVQLHFLCTETKLFYRVKEKKIRIKASTLT